MPKSQKIADIVDLRIAQFDATISSKVISHTIAQKEELNIQTGQIMELFCTAHGRPLPEINWFKDGGVITSKSVSNNFMVSKFGATSSLRITDLKTSDSGNYACRAENINGYIKKWVLVTVTPKMKTTTTSSTTLSSHFRYNKNFPISICAANSCKIEPCVNRNRTINYQCRCPFTYEGEKCKKPFLESGSKRNFSASEERSAKCNNNGSDHLFTLFETLLVCIIASLFLGIICYIFRRKYCCFYNKAKYYPKQMSQGMQAEINNFILVRDVGINVNGHYFEHSGERLMPVAYKRNISMIFQETRIQDVSSNSRLLSSQNSSLSSPIIYEEPIQANQYSPFLHNFMQNSSQAPQSIYFNKSVAQDNSYDSSIERINLTKVTDNSKSESGICSCFEYSPHLHPISSTLLIFNESVSPNLSFNDPRIHVESGQTNIIM